MYSQSDEEGFILEHFQRHDVGRLLDLGAADGTTFSNSRALIEKGWGGVLVDGSLEAHQKLVRLYQANSKVECLHLVFDAEERIAPFYTSGEQINSLSLDLMKAYNYPEPRKTLVKTTRFAEWMRDIGQFKFITMDLDGSNFSLFMCCPLSIWSNTQMICIEHEGKEALIQERLAATHKPLHHTSENLILVRK